MKNFNVVITCLLCISMIVSLDADNNPLIVNKRSKKHETRALQEECAGLLRDIMEESAALVEATGALQKALLMHADDEERKDSFLLKSLPKELNGCCNKLSNIKHQLEQARLQIRDARAYCANDFQ